MVISIVIPVYNESQTIYKILKKINKIKKFRKEVIVVDDGSTDGTKKILKNYCSKLYDNLITLTKNRGKGYACRAGLKKAKGNIVIIQDADLEYDPNDYFKLIKPIKEKKTNPTKNF